MICVVQRVAAASVEVDGRTVASIQRGLAVLVGVHTLDTDADADWSAQRLAGLRVFPDPDGKMNLAVTQLPPPQAHAPRILFVPNFTLCAAAGRGRRPSFVDAMAPDAARRLFDRLAEGLAASGPGVATGLFGADMLVTLANDGPVTILLDSHRHLPRPPAP
jgi:D-tyrosyl-tRNA(Tyr) deacylase